MSSTNKNNLEKLLVKTRSFLPNIDAFFEMLLAEKGLSYNSIISYAFDLKDLALFIRKNKLSIPKIQQKQFTQYLEYLRKNKIANSSYNRKITSIRQYFNFLLSEGLIEKNITADVVSAKQEKLLPNFLNKQEIEQLILACDKISKSTYEKTRARLIVILLFKNGLRVSELISLKDSNIKKENHLYYFDIVGKGSKQRIIPLIKETLDLIDLFKDEKIQFFKGWDFSTDGFLFPSHTPRTNMTRQRAGQIIKTLGLLANMDVSKISPHTLRHSFATHLLSNGVNLKNLQDLLGHKNISTTEIYTHLTYENLEKLLQEKHPLNKKA